MKRMLAVAAVVALSGCHHSSHVMSGENGSAAATDTPDRQAANVRGTFRMVGGPYPGISRPLTGTITIHQQNHDGPVVKTVQTATRGTFATRLSPGRYWFVGTSSHVTGVGCANLHAVTVTDGGVARVQVVCAIP
jgi:predicted lipoprotein